MKQASKALVIPEDPVVFARDFFGFDAKEYQAGLLRDMSKRIVVRWSRQAGNAITGSAGNTRSGYSVKTLTNKIAMSQATLNSLATEYLQSLQQTNSGSPLVCDIAQAALLNSGD